MLQHRRGAEKRQQGMGGTGAPSAALRSPPFSSPSLFQLILLVPADFAPEAVTAVTFFPVAGFGDHPEGGGLVPPPVTPTYPAPGGQGPAGDASSPLGSLNPVSHFLGSRIPAR